MPKTTEIRPLVIGFAPPSDDQAERCAAADRRSWRKPEPATSGRGRPPVHQLDAWLPGIVAWVEPADMPRLTAIARRRGFIVSRIGPRALYRVV